MGDRCRLQVTVYARDHQKFVEAVGDEGDEIRKNEHGHPELEVYGANYGWYEELGAAAVAGCVFDGQHGAGGEYGPHVFASDGQGICHSVPASHSEDVEAVKGYWAAYERVCDLLSRPAVLVDMEEALNG